jgi:hypothetical protein
MIDNAEGNAFYNGLDKFLELTLMKTRIRKTVSFILLIIVCLIAIWILFPRTLLPMGTGSERYAEKWTKRFQGLNSIAEARAEFSNIAAQEFPDGEWIFWVCSDSHGNPWGGTIVTRDGRGITKAFYGHVCGFAILHGESLDEVYDDLLTYYGTTRADYLAKEAKAENSQK